MEKTVFINLPIKELQRSRDFFTALGYTFNEDWCSDKNLAMNVSENIKIMLLMQEKFKEFTQKKLIDPHVQIQVLNTLSYSKKEDVDAIIEKAVKAGGKEVRQKKDHGFMYEGAYEDLDGHVWEAVWMNPEK